MKSDVKIKKGAVQAVKNCMKITSDDKVVIVTDKKQKTVSKYIFDECKKITSAVEQFILEDYGSRPLLVLPKEIEKSVKKSTAVFYMASSYPGEKSALRMPIVRLGVANGREAHMPDIRRDLMEQGMNTDYKLIKEISRKVYNVVGKAKEIHVKTKKGTDFKVTFNPKWKWIICDGDITNMPTRWSNLPDGEVFTAPYTLNGKIVADGAIGDYFTAYNPLQQSVIIEVKNTRVTSITTKNKKLENQLHKYIKQDENSDRIGEFSVGTNVGLKKFVGNMLQDEKFPGVHIAIGDSYPHETLAPFPSKAHCDFVIKKTTIFVDGKEIMRDGKFLI